MDFPADPETIYHCPFCLSTKLTVKRLPQCHCEDCGRFFDIDDTVTTDRED